MAHKALAFSAGDRRTHAVTTALIMGSVMALAQLELVNMAGPGSKPSRPLGELCGCSPHGPRVQKDLLARSERTGPV